MKIILLSEDHNFNYLHQEFKVGIHNEVIYIQALKTKNLLNF